LAGFYFRPFDEGSDNVACFLCNKNLDGWEPADEAWSEHVSHSPTCPLVNLNTEAGRLGTFSTNQVWPLAFLKPKAVFFLFGPPRIGSSLVSSL
jgi:hypothetical protein